MKINQKQASLLAKEVYNRLLRTGATSVPELVKAKVSAFKEKRQELYKVKERAENAIAEHDKTFRALTGDKTGNIRPYNTVSEIIEKMKNVNTPTISDIEDKIILKSMFADENDMESFVSGIVKEFAKKKTVSAN